MNRQELNELIRNRNKLIKALKPDNEETIKLKERIRNNFNQITGKQCKSIVIDYTQDTYEELSHQKKIIDRLSRKIQRLKREYKEDEEIIEKSFEEIARLYSILWFAKEYIRKELSWAVGSEELIKILEGKDEN